MFARCSKSQNKVLSLGRYKKFILTTVLGFVNDWYKSGLLSKVDYVLQLNLFQAYHKNKHLKTLQNV